MKRQLLIFISLFAVAVANAQNTNVLSSKLQPGRYIWPQQFYYAMGDSYTLNSQQGSDLPRYMYPSVLHATLRNSGANLRLRNLGVAGWTSSNILVNMPYQWHAIKERVGSANVTEWPSLMTLLIGVNNISNSTWQVDLQTNIEEICIYALSGCSGIASNTAALPAQAPPGLATIIPGQTKWLVLNDDATVPSAATNSYGIWQQTSPRSGTKGWARVPPGSNGCTHIVILSSPWSQNDNTSVPYSTYNPIRLASSNAVTSLQAHFGAGLFAFADIYGYTRTNIQNGVNSNTGTNDTVFRPAVNGNDHPSPIASSEWAQCVFQTITNQTGWMNSFQ